MTAPIRGANGTLVEIAPEDVSKRIFSNREAYRFLKVEQYFERYKEWERLGDVKSSSYNKNSNTLTLDFIRMDNTMCSMLIQFIQNDTFRVCFNPGKMGKDYTDINTRTVVQDTTEKLMLILKEKESFQIDVKELAGKKGTEMVTRVMDESGSLVKPVMKVEVGNSPFSIKVYNYIDNEEFLVWETAKTPIYFTPNGNDDYAIIQAVKKPSTAEYIGFGEQGGKNLSRNSSQANYFNFDNMRYRQVYNQGPLDCREPLYHSDPFFFEFNVLVNKDSVNAIFIDNPGQLLIDVGYLNTDRYMFGSRFGNMDYYFFIGHTPAEVIDSFTSIVGRSRLKPRYCLGYHQGCYGYDTRAAVEWAVDKYREYKIPLDGMHIDVDIQHNYQTFTIDEGKFPNPKEMFSNLKKKGIKCSTNITPVISNEDENYSTYTQARKNGYFVMDKRYEPNDPESRRYQLYGGGYEYQPNKNDYVEGFNSGQPFIGGVYYGDDSTGKQLGTVGHYADLGREDVRKWWGTQYKYLFEMGLEMVWQDMTTPAIRDYRGDMKGFPFRLLLTDNFTSEKNTKQTPAIKVWNLYSYNLHNATYHGLNNLEGLEEQNKKRNFIIGRGSYTGSHRYAGLWTGDNSSDWDFLKMNVSQALSLGICGVVINGQDIGGFETSYVDGGKWASPELLIRWTAAGAFLPWFRNHYVRKGRKEFQEPFMYVEWFNQYRDGKLPEPQDLYRNVLPICKHYIELRYRLLQLFYDAMFANTLNGLPICRTLFLNDPDDKSLYNDKLYFIDNEFFVGQDLLVAPVLEPEVQNGKNNYGKRDVYLPSDSSWYCFMNNTMPLNSSIEGGTTIRDFDAGLSLKDGYDPHINFIVPVFVREGAIIPTIELEQYVGQLNDESKANPVTLNIYPGEKGNYTMYQDDGVSRASACTIAHPKKYGGDKLAANEYREIKINHKYISENKKTREIILECTHNGYTPKYEKNYFVAILHDPAENKGSSGCLQKVRIGGQEIRLIQGGSIAERSSSLNASYDNAWYYNENINISFIKVMDDFGNNPKVSITIDYV